MNLDNIGHLEAKIAELEKKLDDFKTETMDLVNEDGIRIEKLEKESELFEDLVDTIKQQETIKKEISELQGWTENFTEDMAIKLSELKDIIKANSLIMKLNKSFIFNQKKVLREIIKYVYGEDTILQEHILEKLNGKKPSATFTYNGITTEYEYKPLKKLDGEKSVKSGFNSHTYRNVLNGNHSADSKPSTTCEKCGKSIYQHIETGTGELICPEEKPSKIKPL